MNVKTQQASLVLKHKPNSQLSKLMRPLKLNKDYNGSSRAPSNDTAYTTNKFTIKNNWHRLSRGLSNFKAHPCL